MSPLSDALCCCSGCLPCVLFMSSLSLVLAMSSAMTNCESVIYLFVYYSAGCCLSLSLFSLLILLDVVNTRLLVDLKDESSVFEILFDCCNTDCYYSNLGFLSAGSCQWPCLLRTWRDNSPIFVALQLCFRLCNPPILLFSTVRQNTKLGTNQVIIDENCGRNNDDDVDKDNGDHSCLLYTSEPTRPY